MLKEKTLAVLEGLKNMFHSIVPDQEYLDGDEDTQADVNNIRKMLDDDSVEPLRQIENLYLFNSEWFPDEIEKEEQDEYRALLLSASELIEQEKTEIDYLVVVDSEFVRDVQVANVPEAEHESDNWSDASGQLVLGTFSAVRVEQAIEKAAIKYHIAGECLSAYALR